MTELAELVHAYRENRMPLAGLFDAVAARGPVPDPVYRTELAWLHEQRSGGELDVTVVNTLSECLEATQHGTEQGTHAALPALDDVTRVNPARAGISGHEDTDTSVPTRVQAPAAPAEEDATVVKPALVARTGVDTHDVSLQSSWRRTAAARPGAEAGVGTLLKGRFLLERELGRGGMGVVYLARDERKVEARDRDPYVAVKVLNDEFRRHPDSLIALQRESRRAQQLGHDNIVRVYDFDKDGTTVFMTMEYIDGRDLRTLIREYGSGMSLAQAWPLVEGMAHALARAHAAGVVHSDFKPGNVMVTPQGGPKVFDFGIARAGKFIETVDDDRTVFDAATLGALTPAYASLQMLRGEPPTPSDDVYALGCVVFELLTGRHPFGRLSAEAAMNEGRRPPAVDGLGARQYKTLCASVAFSREQRLASTQALLEGLRPRSRRERYAPTLAALAVLLALAGGGAWGVSHYLQQRRTAAVMDRFTAGRADSYANEDQAVRALDDLGAEQRDRVVLAQSERIQNFFLHRLDGYWNPPAGRLDFAHVQHVWRLRNQLKLFSPRLDARHHRIVQQRNGLLNTLDTQLNQAIQRNALFPDQAHNVIDILSRIRAVDPGSDTLKDAELELKYDQAIAQSLADHKVAQARQRAALALRLFPDSSRLKLREKQLQASAAATAATASGALPLGVPAARDALPGLLAQAEDTPSWRQQALAVMDALKSTHSAALRRSLATLAQVIAAQAASVTQAMPAQQHLAVVQHALGDMPASTSLQTQQRRLQSLLEKQHHAMDQDVAKAKVASLIESLKLSAAANDSAKALSSLKQIKALEPHAPFLKKQGPNLVGIAYLGQARDDASHGHWRRASARLASAVKVLGDPPELRWAQQRYALIQDIVQLRNDRGHISNVDYLQLKTRLARLRQRDPDGMKQLEQALQKGGQIDGDSLDAMLAALKPRVVVMPGRIQVGARPTVVDHKAVTHGDDPCAVAGVAGSGTLCVDQLVDGSRGPAMLVVPASRQQASFAMTRNEISASDYNRYCQVSHRCKPLPLSDGIGRFHPARRISVRQALEYARWLSAVTGRSYHLPSDAQWIYAAHAGRDWERADDSYCQAQAGSASAGRANVAPHNPWGLINMAGSVSEWVVDDGHLAIRGGSYLSSRFHCSADHQRGDDGKARPDVGFRLVRDVR